STYAFPFLRLNVMPEIGCTALLPRLVGYGRAMQICLTAATLDAREAERVGLISEVHPDEELAVRAIALGEQIAAYPALQTNLTRELLWKNAGEFDVNAILQRETDAFVAMFRARKRQDAAKAD
ncbi:MAG: enoyl-CoA hydratase/isomerase family protein, partial [Caulobacteraceae bacterium]|nr:enoyl-CoA hydratase/isomerase family protein [Caulobacteraceae bacterium]